MSKPRFIHLHVHSDYSVVDGIAKIDQLIEKTRLFGMPALAITDFTNLFGVIKFYKSARRAGIKPIIGADFLVNDAIKKDEFSEITILAANNTGYKNLIFLISHAYQKGIYHSKPFITRNWLIDFNEGLIIISSSCRGDIGKYLLSNNKKKLEEVIAFYARHFHNRYYLEVVRTNRINESNYICSVIDFAISNGLPVVATNDVRFLNREDFYAHEIRVAIQNGYTISDKIRPNVFYSPEQYMRSEEEMCKLFADLPEALFNSVEIARRCNVNICLDEYHLPKFPIDNISPEDYLIQCARKGLKNRMISLFPDINIRNKKNKIYSERLNYEIEIINRIGFSSYFLIVMEFVQWAKDNGIPVGPGRGSGAGSLVAYSLKITEIDPIEFDLLFERFLNQERISMPDFDIDFCMEKRDLVIDHVIEVYGKHSVSQIVAFGTMTAKAVVRDVGRALGYTYGFVNNISKLIPDDIGMTLEKAFSAELKLRDFYHTDEEVRVLINIARKLEGIVRNISKHAGGIVIAPTDITHFVPIYHDTKSNYQITQFDKNDIEQIGLVKFDFLGLRTLTIIDLSIKMINSKLIRRQVNSITIDNIPLDDKLSFDVLCRAETTGVFQLESNGMKDLIKRLQPDRFEDIIALIALYRPGPLQSGMVDNFINRKHGKETISYPDIECQHSLLQSVLKSTYGIILYQEQIMKIAQVLAGYTLGKADILRRAIGKKKPEEMRKQREIFKLGAKNIGINNMLSMKIFDIVEKFAAYGFNKSHSTAYALISYHTLWLKTHYPAEFMSAAMTADINNTKKVVELINECNRMGITVLSPNINTGQYYFYVNQNNEIVYGMGAIKGIGEEAIKAIINERNRGGYFHGLFDLCERVDPKKINRRILDCLVVSGSFDSLEKNRSVLISSLDQAIKIASKKYQDKNIGQDDMFKELTEQIKTKKYPNYPLTLSSLKEKIIEGERETLGLYLTNYSINQYIHKNHDVERIQIKDLQSINKEIVSVMGIILSVKVIITRNNRQVGICILDDTTGQIDILLSENILKKHQSLLKKNKVIFIQGKVIKNNSSNRLKIIAEKFIKLYQSTEN